MSTREYNYKDNYYFYLKYWVIYIQYSLLTFKEHNSIFIKHILGVQALHASENKDTETDMTGTIESYYQVLVVLEF